MFVLHLHLLFWIYSFNVLFGVYRKLFCFNYFTTYCNVYTLVKYCFTALTRTVPCMMQTVLVVFIYMDIVMYIDMLILCYVYIVMYIDMVKKSC